MSSKTQARSQSDENSPFKLRAAQLEEFQDKLEHTIEFTVRDYVDEDVVTSEVHLLTDYKIIGQFTQTELDAAEDDNENDEDDVDREISQPWRDQIRQTLEILRSLPRWQRAKDAKKRRNYRKFHCSSRISNLLLLTFFKLQDQPF